MLEFYNNAVNELKNIEKSEETLAKLNEQYESLRSQTEEYAHILSAKRKEAGDRLCLRIQEELNFLDMPFVKFVVSNKMSNFTPNGIDNIEFLVSANLGEEPRPLSKIASGGELSRIMLAIKNVLAEHNSVDTLIFDEVDTGISGRAAQKVALKLHQLAKLRQVICVTHLSQLAVEADTHLLIEKNFSDNRTYTTVKNLDFEGRKHEIARIIGGATVTETTLKSAEELLISAKNTN